MAALLLAGVAVVEFVLDRGTALRAPHVIFIVLDTVRADRVSFGGTAERDTTPYLASLAAKGVVFTKARSPSNWTLPSHASMFTGLSPTEHGCHFEHRWLTNDAQTLAEVMKVGAPAYLTAGFSSNVNVSRTFNMHQGFDHWFESWSDEEVRKGKSASEMICDRALTWIDERTENDPGPQFVFMNFMDAHLPYHASPGYEKFFGVPSIDAATLEAPDFLDRVLAGEVEVDESMRAALELAYDNALRGLDARLQAFFRQLEQRGFLNDCVIVVTSDHGENLGEHGVVDHQGSMHETVLRVPLLITGSGVPEGGSSDRPVVTTDLFRWIQDLRWRAFKPEAAGRVRPAISERMRPIDLLTRLEAAGHADAARRVDGPETALVSPLRPALKLVRRAGRADALLELSELVADEGRAISIDDADGEFLVGLLDDTLRFARPLRETLGPEPRVPEDDEDEAIAELERLGYVSTSRMRGGSVHAQEHLARGNRAHEAGRVEDARAEWRAAATLAPDFAGPWFNLAVAAEVLSRGDNRAIRAAWEKYLEVALRSKDDQTKIQQAYERLDALPE